MKKEKGWELKNRIRDSVRKYIQNSVSLYINTGITNDVSITSPMMLSLWITLLMKSVFTMKRYEILVNDEKLVLVAGFKRLMVPIVDIYSFIYCSIIIYITNILSLYFWSPLPPLTQCKAIFEPTNAVSIQKVKPDQTVDRIPW